MLSVGRLNNTTLVSNFVPCIPQFTALNISICISMSIIFILSVIGNTLVTITIIQNKRMRTVTNIFLFNLAVSDILLTIFCLPPTLIAILFRCYFFGPIVCVIQHYIQPVTVTASAYTLVVIALERYQAICRPLRSREKWKSKKHSIRMVIGVWLSALLVNIPFAVYAVNKQLPNGSYNCRTIYTKTFEQVYLSVIIGIMFILPLTFLIIAYTMVIRSLRKGMPSSDSRPSYPSKIIARWRGTISRRFSKQSYNSEEVLGPFSGEVPNIEPTETMQLRSTNTEQSMLTKKRVIKMLAVIVFEFFICWIPLYICTIYKIFYQNPNIYIYLFAFVLAYTSTCCNPITYCFMNQKFRTAFLVAFKCASPQQLDATSYAMPIQGTGTAQGYSDSSRIALTPVNRWRQSQNGFLPLQPPSSQQKRKADDTEFMLVRSTPQSPLAGSNASAEQMTSLNNGRPTITLSCSTGLIYEPKSQVTFSSSDNFTNEHKHQLTLDVNWQPNKGHLIQSL